MIKNLLQQFFLVFNRMEKRIRDLELEVNQARAERDHFEHIAIEAQRTAKATEMALRDQQRAYARNVRKWANMGR